MTHHQTARQSQHLLGLLGHQYVQYYPSLGQLTGSIKAALMLGHALYWTRHYLQHHPERNGWFWKTGREWTDATGLSLDEQQSARLILINAGLLEERANGFPRRLHFRVDLQQLGLQLAQNADSQFCGWHWDSTIIRSLLGRPIAFFKPLVDLTNSVSAALYLSHMLQAQRSALMRRKINRQGYFHCCKNEAGDTLAMGNKAVRNARQKLRALQLIDESLEGGYQVKLMARVNVDNLSQRLQQRVAHSPALAQVFDFKGMAQTAIPVSGNGLPLPKSPDQHRDMGKASSSQPLQVVDSKGMAVCAIPVSENGQGVPFSRHQYREKGQTSIRFTTIQKEEQLPQTTEPTATHVQTAGCCGDDAIQHQIQQPQQEPVALTSLIFPTQLSVFEQRAASAMLGKLHVDQHQPVIDEWAGQLTNPAKSIRNKLGYLRTIISAAEQGSFVPTVGLVVGEARARLAALEAQQITQLQQHDVAIQKMTQVPSHGDLREQAFAEIRKILPMNRGKWSEDSRE